MFLYIQVIYIKTQLIFIENDKAIITYFFYIYTILNIINFLLNETD